MAIICSNIEKAKFFLRKNQVIGIPTETVYGLAANAYNTSAVASIFYIKKRPYTDPLIVHTDDIAKVVTFVDIFPDWAMILAKKFWPGPLTLLLKKKQKKIHDSITANSLQVAVRIPNHPLTLSLLQGIEFPIVAPSANPFGYISPTHPQHVEKQLGYYIPYILDGGRCSLGLESTIIGFENNRPMIYRLGSISIAEIENCIGPVILKNNISQTKAPGMLSSHYAPKKPLLIGNIEVLLKKYGGKRIGVLSFQENYDVEIQKVLSPLGSLKEAGKNLFHYLRLLDAEDIDIILTSYVPQKGIGHTINDRLKRASVGRQQG